MNGTHYCWKCGRKLNEWWFDISGQQPGRKKAWCTSCSGVGELFDHGNLVGVLTTHTYPIGAWVELNGALLVGEEEMVW